MMNFWISVRRYVRNTAGNIAVISALAMAAILGISGLAIDYGRAASSRTQMQAIADAAVLLATGARNLTGSAGDIQTKRIALATSYLKEKLPTISDVVVVGTPMVSAAGDNVNVKIDFKLQGSLIAALGGLGGSATVSTGVTPSSAGTSPWWVQMSVDAGSKGSRGNDVCILALNASAANAISFSGNATLTGVNCAVQSNSNSTSAISVTGAGALSATSICAPGGVRGNKVTPAPVTCAAMADPWAAMAMPTPAASCTSAFTNVAVKNRTANLGPGTYCGGITLQTGGVANLAPGLYIIKDGLLSAGANSTINAPSGVTIYLTGNTSRMDIASGSSLTLKAPTASTATSQTLPYIGIAIMQDRITGKGNINQITSKGGVNITGAFYAPSQSLAVTANGQMNASSSYFPIIVDTLSAGGTGDFMVQFDYKTAGYDAPPGLIKKGKNILTQ